LALAEMDEKQKISLLLDAYKDYQFKVSDYRIQIFSGGLNQAQEIEKEAIEAFVDWPVSLDFISPSYRVRVGAFKTRLEAEKNLIALRKKYPASVLLKPKKNPVDILDFLFDIKFILLELFLNLNFLEGLHDI
jgi:hypothetical protein